MVAEVRSAGIEGFVILGAIYLILNLVSRAGRKSAQGSPAPSTTLPGDSSSTEGGAASLEKILREIQRVQQQKHAARLPPAQRNRPIPATQAAPPQRRAQGAAEGDRGPLGRHSLTRLPSAEEVEERTSLEEAGSLESGERTAGLRQVRSTTDSDDSAEEVVQRRIREVEARNRPLDSADHRRFDAQVRSATKAADSQPVVVRSRLQEALIWREILGPPKSME